MKKKAKGLEARCRQDITRRKNQRQRKPTKDPKLREVARKEKKQRTEEKKEMEFSSSSFFSS